MKLSLCRNSYEIRLPYLDWVETNEMIANPEKFHLMFLSPNILYLINQQSINIRGISIKSETKFMLPGVDMGNRFTFHMRHCFRRLICQPHKLVGSRF